MGIEVHIVDIPLSDSQTLNGYFKTVNERTMKSGKADGQWR